MSKLLNRFNGGGSSSAEGGNKDGDLPAAPTYDSEVGRLQSSPTASLAHEDLADS